MTTSTIGRRTRLGLTTAFLAAGSLVLSACAGGAGGGSGGGTGGGEGFEWGASQEEVNEVIADLEPVELVYQAGAQSPNSISAASATEFKDYVETRSGGKISVEIVYGQAIAGYAEIDEALADGRIDVAYALPIYDPSKYPEFDALATASGGLPNSPVLGELVGNAAIIDVAWHTDSILKKYEELGLTPLMPVISTGNHHAICRDPGSALSDWKGRQVRIPSVSQERVVEAIGATPVSLEYVETFEALQRGTIDCTFAQLLPSEEAGLLEIASNVSYAPPESSLSSRGAGASLAGSGYQQLPLAYQQIIFDAGEKGFDVSSKVITNGTAAGVEQLHGAGGSMQPLDEETAKIYKETNDKLASEVNDSDILGDDIAGRMKEAADKWSGIAAEHGIEDGGDYDSLDEWYDEADYDFSPFAAQLFEESFLPHRPS